MKKKAALFFVFLTNIILLAHAVVPHHHLEHLSYECATSCDEHDKCHHQPCSDTSHDHGTLPETDHCVLSQAVGIPSNMLRQAYVGKSLLLDSDASIEWVYFCNNFQLNVTTSGFVRPPLVAFTYANYASAVLGLRAPPVR